MAVIDRCHNDDLTAIFHLSLTHDATRTAEDEALQNFNIVPVGSYVNLFCQYENERITADIYDDDPDDYRMSIMCRPDRKFDLPNENYPKCLAWCPREKPEAPEESGLNLSPDDDNDRYVSG